MTIPSLVSEVLRLVRNGQPSTETQYLFDLGAASDRLTERCIVVSLESGARPDTQCAILPDSIGVLVNNIDSASRELFARVGKDRASMLLNSLIQASMSISQNCKESLEDIGETV